MHSEELLKWLKKNNLLTIAKNHSIYFKKVLKDSLGANKEELLIIGDYGSQSKRVAPLMCAAYHLAAERLGIKNNVVMQDVKETKKPADKEVIKSLQSLGRKNIVVMNVSNKLGSLKRLGKSYRRFAKENKLKFTSTTGLGSLSTNNFYYITRSLNLNYKKIRNVAAKLKAKLDWAREVRITTPKGTDIIFDITGQKAVALDGDYSKPGRGGNIPPGEVYIAPKENGVYGQVVIDGSFRHHEGTEFIDRPIKLIVEKGRVRKIDGFREAKILERSLAIAEKKAKYPASVKMIGELGIGINPKSGIIGAMVIDEKTLGTAHVAIGSNYWFGGSVFTIIHLDQVFKNPKIEIDGKEFKLNRSDLV